MQNISIIYSMVKNTSKFNKKRKRLVRRTRRYKGILGGSAPANKDRTYIFIVSYRARPPNEIRKVELQHMIKTVRECFTARGLKFKIIIVEQNNDHPFNRALLKNIGFLEGEKKYDIPKVYLHINADYYIDTSKEFPKELEEFDGNGVLDIYSIDKDDTCGYVGGCCCFNSDTFKKVNGFPNNLHGWGGCDIAFRYRVNTVGAPYIRNSITNNGWIVASDVAPRNGSRNPDNIAKSKDDIMSNGLKTCVYTNDGPGEFNDETQHVYHALYSYPYE